ncbi:hypothetical protein [Lentzea albidocapillata]|nr:hypothetical protein [Lentzea albidocapillata]
MEKYQQGDLRSLLMAVYTDRIRTDSSPQRGTEPDAEFYERMAGPFWDQARDVITEWWSHLPEHAQRGFRKRLLDRNSNANVSSALWELYLHEMLLGAGCTVEIERPLGSRGKTPDFLVTRGDEQFVVEAIWTSERADDALTAALLDTIDRLPSPNFRVSVTINRAGSTAPQQKRLKSGLTRWLAELDPDHAIADLMQRHRPLPSYTWQEADWSISFMAFPRDPGRRGIPSSRTIGMYPPMKEPLRSDLVLEAVRRKGKKYGELSMPFIVAVGQATYFPEDDDIGNSLYGSPIEYIRSGDSSALRRLPDGYWTTPHTDSHSRVSGVLVVNNPGPWSWAKNTPVLWCSPNSRSIDAPVLPTWGTMHLASGQVERQPPAAPANTALGLPEDWPIGDPSQRHTR